MSAEKAIHPNDQELMERIHSQHCEVIQRLSDDAIKFQDASYALGRLRGKQEAAPQWVPVTERMPEIGEPLLVAGLRSDGEGYWRQTGTRREDGLYNGYGSYLYSVTHWMPLPAAPEVQA
ncbi:DUF551 domain-containing protein [Pseudomonas sp. DY-1]|uniref:DUF551 domain-containing protein n=1 Tax=Pseudomonas sp. DY-1 TaxID=1755504 RepID=UPI000EA8CBC0|nr:DUF551 domain-containing protein [Pseudomonas sp. DY-1]AYF87443.1 DUF551 domain-containing protein [Pseudomonas sp. DY-1]